MPDDETASSVPLSLTRCQCTSARKNSITVRFARTLKSLRERRGLSIEAFSERSEISIARLRRLETLEGNPRVGELARIARALRI